MPHRCRRLEPGPSRSPARLLPLLLGTLCLLVLACAAQGPRNAAVHRWWAGLGPVLPHDNFPGDCKLCHVGEKWNTLTGDFRFDHEKETGVPLHGAHQTASCLRCHNDRGPVATFAQQGCAGCHENVHQGDLSPDCTTCHNENDWRPSGQIAMHSRTRFPLTGTHTLVACNRCHPGAFVGNFMPTDPECVTCHQRDLQGAINPPHLGLGWVDHCNRCHIPTNWKQARTI